MFLCAIFVRFDSGGDSAFQKNIDYACGAGADCSAISQNEACGGDSAFQKNIDYACGAGAGADCAAISQNGACFNPNTARDHCSYAVNSFYQRKGQTSGSCDFAGTATVSPTTPNVASGCVYPSSPRMGQWTMVKLLQKARETVVPKERLVQAMAM